MTSAKITRVRLLSVGILTAVLTACSGGANSPSSKPVAAASPGTTSSEASAPAEPIMSQLTTTPVAGLPECTKYEATADSSGKPQVLNGEACRRPDGSWAIAEQPAGADYIYQAIYVPPPETTDWDGPCFYGPYGTACSLYVPFGFSIGFPFFVDVHRHFRPFVFADFDRFHSFRPIGRFRDFQRHTAFGDFRRGFHGGAPRFTVGRGR
jgi:hypothetical protein